MRRVHVVLLTLLTALAGVLAAGGANAADHGPGSVVKEVPVRGTPHVLDGKVSSVVQVGNTIVLGGTFTQARNDASTTALTRSNLLAFDATTKEISTTFLPQPNGSVNVVLPTGDGETVYVGGSFTSIGGVARKNLARVRVSDGAVVTGFNAGSVAGQVKDLRLAGGRLWVAGSFTHIAGYAQKALATINPTTGKFNTFMRTALAGIHNSGTTTVAKIDVDPQGTRMVGIGNFDTVGGVKSHQILQLDLTGAAAALSAFRTTFYESRCSTSFDSYMRDLDFSPDGTFFVVSTTGAYGGAGSACDSTARFEANAGAGAKPSWIDNTGGDTTYAVEITDSVVYTGGHARWQNNPFRGDTPGQGAVPRPGIAALDPANGLPLSWNPTRDRGVGVFDFLVTDQGLWVASDTTRIGADYLRSRIALLPLGGTQWPGVSTPKLPNDVYSVRTGSGGIQRRATTDGSTFAASQPVPASGLSTDSIRGSFMLNGWLYIAWSNGTFDRRTFDGASFGTPVAVDTASELTPLTDWSSDITSMTGLFYDSGRIYFTRSGSSTLFYRYFTPESDVVGAQRLTASTNVTGIDFSQVRGMFTAGDKLYWAMSNGDLRRLGWAQGDQSGRPVAGAAQVVSGPGKDGISWSSLRSLFLYQDSAGDPPPKTPVADFSSSCASLTCTFDAGGSSVEGATITDWSWDFGGGSTSPQAAPSHTFAASGTYPVKLTVTSSKGLSSSVTKQVQVTRVNQMPTADFTWSCDQLSCSFDAVGSSDKDGTIAGYAWSFGDGGSGAGSPVTHAYADAGARQVTLTVTDNEGGTGQVTKSVSTTTASADFVDAASTNSNGRSNHTVTVPGTVRAGDTLVLFLTVNSTNVTMGSPAGWAELQSGSVDGLRSSVWTRTATAADAGTVVSVPTSGTAKSAMTLAGYRPSAGTTLTATTSAKAFTASGTTSLTTPEVDVTQPGSWLVSYWGAKASAALTFTTPPGNPVRTDSMSTGTTGSISARLADSGGPVTAGSRGGLAADTGTTASRGATFSVVLVPQAG